MLDRSRGRRTLRLSLPWTTAALLGTALLTGLVTVPVTVLAPPASAAHRSASAGAVLSAASPVAATYKNPLRPTISGGGTVQSCADPSVIRGEGAYARTWFMYCTSDPLNDAATSGSGGPVFTRLPTMRSTDLVHWRFVGSALAGKPSWAGSHAKLWAPDVVYSSTYHRYYLTFAVTDTVASVGGGSGCDSDPAVGVAVSSSPTGPWKTQSRPLVPPRRLGPGCDFASTIDSDVLGRVVRGQGSLYYGGFRGGIYEQPITLSSTGMRTSGEVTRLTPGRRFEGANVISHQGWYYLFASSGSCCQGPLSGYGAFVARSQSPAGPFVDRQGVPVMAPRSGGTPTLVTNGNRWVGPGHTSAIQDFGGQWWMVYHAVRRSDPFYATEPGFTRRPPLLDPLDWSNGWPRVRSGRGPSSSRIPAPAAQPGQVSRHRPSAPPPDVLGAAVDARSDEFDGDTLSDQWSWVRKPDAGTYGVEDGAFRFDTQPGGLSDDNNTASVLTEPAPSGDYVMQTAVSLDVPVDSSTHDYVQAGLIVRDTDDRLVKVVHVSFGSTRQTQFGVEVPEGAAGYPRVGSTNVGSPSDTTWLRVVRRATSNGTTYRAYTSRDGNSWVRGGTWVQDQTGDDVRLGLISLGGTGYTARFDHVRVWRLGS